MVSIAAGTTTGLKAGYITESANPPAAAVAECPEGKELEDGVFIRGAMLVSWINGLERSKRCFVPSASVQESAIAAHGTRRFLGWRPVAKNAPAAINPQRAPAVPATVSHRITTVNGAHFKPKIIRNRPRSRSLVFLTKLFNGSKRPLVFFG